MSYMRHIGRVLTKVALCTAALGGGMAMGRYTDIARHDLSLGVARAHAAAPDRPVRRTSASGRAAAPVVLAAHSVEQLGGDEAAEPPPAAPHDGFGVALRGGRIMRGATPHRLMLFTFDDGPDRNTTPLLLDRLDRAGVRAVFFLTGANLRGTNVAERKNQKIAKDAVARGHWVASHGMNHAQLPLLNDARALREVLDEEKVFERVLGQRPWLIRPPGGSRSARIDRLLAERGYTTVLWNLGAADYQVHSAEEVHATFRAVLERRETHGEMGGIVLLHDTYPWSVEAFQLIVDDLLARNCELLERGEELYDFADDPALFFEPRGDADPSAEAAPARLDDDVLALRQARLREETAQRCRAGG